jgi:SAM-dependent methyltransferase
MDTPSPATCLTDALTAAVGCPVVPVSVDIAGYRAFRREYLEHDTRGGIDDEKTLEYYLSCRFLEFDETDVLIDIAAQDCPFAFFVRSRVGCRSYRQDLYYVADDPDAGDIKGDATALPLPDGSISKVSLHNSIEHFDGDADIRLMRELRRVLRPGGRACLSPLFVEAEPREFVDTQWGRGAQFSRIYSPGTLADRLLRADLDLDATVFFVANAGEIAPECYLRYFMVLTRRP